MHMWTQWPLLNPPHRVLIGLSSLIRIGESSEPEDDVDLMSDVLLPLNIVRGDGNPPCPIPGGLLL